MTVFLRKTSDSKKSLVLVSTESNLNNVLIFDVGYIADTRYIHTNNNTDKKLMKSIMIIISKKSILSKMPFPWFGFTAYPFTPGNSIGTIWYNKNSIS